ncbi:N-acetylmuramoyl-L-alanine amidase [Nostocoides sp. HKS02]|uniref:N-acetylmuramoyl-L-alanine amidase n=1 Tax=Nostocoides sp. HKS02 TaxID=1813880 RepID=UPI0012B4F661|nr:N-acetylmuramoyl-L-alanine amidase [Tetrasphaera sp. HKS02]QGN58650.1 cell wall hydrolase [Tetrasphaera sp. HKS02]
MSDSKYGLLGLGSRGPAVADVRARLASLPADQLPEGAGLTDPAVAVEVFDEVLERAVRAFQQHKGLIVDGVVGVETFAAIDGARWSLGDRILMHTPGHLQRGEDVVALQERLNTLGFAAGRVDGRFGPETERAVRSFQRSYGLPGDGSVGPETLRAFEDLRRSVSGGSATILRERELIRRSGHSLSGRTIVLDPGHGGSNTGASAHGLVESQVVMDLARRIEGRLTAIGVSVIYTRTDSTCPTEDERAALANAAGADLVISLHCDSHDAGDASGVATFFFGRDRATTWSAVGEHFADLLLREVVARTGLANCRSHGRSWTLLQQTRMPAVRVEAGYLSHPEDAARLADPAFRDTVAEAVLVSLQRLYLGDDDTATTGVLRLGDLRAFLAAHG